jgi:2-polyprenyl-6-hydroxyphenyl methylase/3-demethylubiquinone-9 3-methyltransferase
MSRAVAPEGLIEQAGLKLVDRKGFVFNPLLWSWSVSDRDLSVNYVTARVKG